MCHKKEQCFIVKEGHSDFGLADVVSPVKDFLVGFNLFHQLYFLIYTGFGISFMLT